MPNREITHKGKADSSLKNSIVCKDQIFFLLTVERIYFKELISKLPKTFYENTMQKLDLRLNIQIL